MSNRFLTILALTFMTSGAYGDVELETPKTVGTKQFVAVFTDRLNRLSWSKVQGKFSNGCLDVHAKYDFSKCTVETGADGSRQVKVEDSKAAKACRDIGGRLPTKQEIESLIRNFDHIEKSFGPVPTEIGTKEMENVLGERDLGSDSWIWSSTVHPTKPGKAIVFDVYDIYLGRGPLWRDEYIPVRCVAGP